MSDLDTASKADQEIVDTSRYSDEGWTSDSEDEPGDDKVAEIAAEADSADEEQEDDSPISPAPTSTPGDAEWGEIRRQLGEWDNRVTVLPSSEFDPNDLEPAPPVVYVDKPFTELHYLYNYLRVSNEDSCCEYAQKYLGENLRDRPCLRWTLDSRSFENLTAPGQVELEGWNDFFKVVGLPKGNYELRMKLFSANNKLRQAAVHRRHWELSKENLEFAMTLPAVLGDDQRASEIEQVYEAFLQDSSTLDAGMRDLVNRRLYTQDNPPVLIPELLGQIQSLLEVSAFRYAMEVDPAFIKENDFEVPEQVELPEYWRRWDQTCLKIRQHPDSLSEYPDPDGRGMSFRFALRDVKDMRNYAVHRKFAVDPECSSAEEINKRVWSAKAFASMVGDPATAEKIELIASTWLAKYRPAVDEA